MHQLPGILFPWTVVNAQTVEQRTPDLSTVIQEIVSRSDWQAGNDLAVIISGSGERTAESFDGEAAAAPLLHVDYTLGPVVNQLPTAQLIAHHNKVMHR